MSWTKAAWYTICIAAEKSYILVNFTFPMGQFMWKDTLYVQVNAEKLQF